MSESESTTYVQRNQPYEHNSSHNLHPAKSTWPPDFSKLDSKHQFRLERRYKRRTQLKWARPRLMAWTRIAQWVGCVGVAVYGVFFMDWGRELGAPGRSGSGPFEGPRSWIGKVQEDFRGARDAGVSTKAENRRGENG